MFDQQVIFLYARDLEESPAFYGEVLGLPLVLDQGSVRIFRTSRSSFLGVGQCNEKRPSMPGGIIVTLVTNDVDEWYERLRSKGVAFEAPPSQNDTFNIYHCFLRDPDGYQIEIQRFGDPAWPKPD
tara:strand:- start:198 stop:575 length:378 start_codon:yes stop_codon:yes gene_type:complete